MTSKQTLYEKFVPQTEHCFETYKNPDSMPDISKRPSFDALLGFPNGREVIKPVVSEDEMFHAGIPAPNRDYCGHFTMAFDKCKHRYPMLHPMACADLRHGLLYCLQNEQIIRRKEYERERRLMAKASK